MFYVYVSKEIVGEAKVECCCEDCDTFLGDEGFVDVMRKLDDLLVGLDTDASPNTFPDWLLFTIPFDS